MRGDSCGPPHGIIFSTLKLKKGPQCQLSSTSVYMYITVILTLTYTNKHYFLYKARLKIMLTVDNDDDDKIVLLSIDDSFDIVYRIKYMY
jgi:hypothetical protein